MKHVTLRGETLPAIGLGTWRMGESPRARGAELAAVREAVRLGYRLFDTAEMYGEGGAETVLGEALGAALAAGEVRRDELFIVSKVYPQNASFEGVQAACARSRQRLGAALGAIDLYLLHWSGSHPLKETVSGFELLQQQGHIRHWGVSNFDLEDMQQLWAVPGGKACAANQVWYSASERGIEHDLLGWQQQQGVLTMAYSPIDQASLASDDTLADVGRALGATAAQVALAWLLRQPGVAAIPKATQPKHLKDNFAAAGLSLDEAALQRIDAVYPPPRHKTPLAMN